MCASPIPCFREFPFQPLARLMLLGFLAVLISLYNWRNGSNGWRPEFAGSDFRLLWLSGKVWLDGLNPYGPEFDVYYVERLGFGPSSHFWVYPPHWFVLTAPISLLPFEAAHKVWTAMSICFVAGAAWFLGRALFTDRQAAIPIALITYLVISATQMTAFALSIGQTMPLITLGTALFVYSMMRNKSGALIASLLILSLKPQFGLAFFLLVAIQPKYWVSIVITGVIGVLLLLPAFAIAGVGETIAGFIGNIGRYSGAAYEPNIPVNLTGPTQLWYRATGDHIPFAALYLPYILLVTGMGIYFWRRKSSPPSSTISMMIFLVVAAAFFAPLHTYDLMVLMTIVPLILALIVWRGLRTIDLFLAGTLLLCLRGINLNTALGLGSIIKEGMFAGSFLMTLLSLVLLGASIVLVLASRRQNEAKGLDGLLLRRAPISA